MNTDADRAAYIAALKEVLCWLLQKRCGVAYPSPERGGGTARSAVGGVCHPIARAIVVPGRDRSLLHLW
jgi:hypothetical protein